MSHFYFHAVGGQASNVPAAREAVDEHLKRAGLRCHGVSTIEQAEVRRYAAGVQDSAGVSLSADAGQGVLVAMSAHLLPRLGADYLALSLFSLATALDAYLGRTAGAGLGM